MNNSIGFIMDHLLKVENLKKYFPTNKDIWGRAQGVVRAVDGLDFQLHKRETLGLVGESGCGKSTTGRLAMRLIEPTDGRIWLNGKEITHLSRRELRPFRTSIQMIFQDPYSSLSPRMTVRNIIGEGLKLKNDMHQDEKEEMILDTMSKVGLRPEHYNRYPHQFSGGQRQRIGIARAIILRPEIVIADEPVSALDVSIQAQVINLLERLKEEFNLSYLFISHDLSVVEHISDRIAVMYLGRIMEMASNEQIYGNPKHPYTHSLLSAVPQIDSQKRKTRIILKGDVPSPLNPPSGCYFHPRCQYRKKKCETLRPKYRESTAGHWTACHFPLQ